MKYMLLCMLTYQLNSKIADFSSQCSPRPSLCGPDTSQYPTLCSCSFSSSQNSVSSVAWVSFQSYFCIDKRVSLTPRVTYWYNIELPLYWHGYWVCGVVGERLLIHQSFDAGLCVLECLLTVSYVISCINQAHIIRHLGHSPSNQEFKTLNKAVRTQDSLRVLRFFFTWHFFLKQTGFVENFNVVDLVFTETFLFTFISLFFN